ncbi:MAG TPA: flagellar hook-associated protein FlgL [Candidatus Dormibacteraeota bacterium]|nr:flagellar hook-associated protein FlgL [Candidatus Dormibacteraeota bacterium]
MSVRVDPNILPDLLSGLNETRQQLNQADAELASGRTINQPSDNPAGTAALVLIHAAQSQTDTFQQNITDLQSKMQIADSALSSAETAIQQAISVGVEAGNSTLSDQDRQAIAQQLSGIQQQLVGIANSTAGGTCLFGGTLVTTQPFTLNPSDPSGVTYNGNSSVVSVEIASGQTVTTNVPGNQLFLNSAGTVLGALNQLITAVQTNSGIAAANTAFGQAASEFSTQRLAYGTSLNQMQSTDTFLANDQVQLQTQESNIAGADLAQVTTNFSQAEVAYASLLESEGKILNLPNLLTYLQ